MTLTHSQCGSPRTLYRYPLVEVRTAWAHSTRCVGLPKPPSRTVLPCARGTSFSPVRSGPWWRFGRVPGMRQTSTESAPLQFLSRRGEPMTRTKVAVIGSGNVETDLMTCSWNPRPIFWPVRHWSITALSDTSRAPSTRRPHLWPNQGARYAVQGRRQVPADLRRLRLHHGISHRTDVPMSAYKIYGGTNEILKEIVAREL
jgi:hypothetical protein